MATPIPKNVAPISPWDFAGWAKSVRARDGLAAAVGVCTDSRAVAPGNAFFALKGEQFDGGDYVDQAIASGATLIVTEREFSTDRAHVVVVSDALRALGFAASMHLCAWRRSRRDRDRARTIGITGSAGKTTTKQIALALASTLGDTHATLGNLNNRIGLPMVVLGLQDHHRFAVLEMGMSVRGEIYELVQIAPPDVAVITNVGVAHAEGVGGDRVDVAREKGAIFGALGEHGVAIVNADDDAAAGQLSLSRAKIALFFGRSERADYRLISVQTRGVAGTRITFERPGIERRKQTLEVDSPLLGYAAAIDFLAALAAVEAAGVTSLEPSAIQSAMRTLANASSRGDVIRLGDGTIVIDDSYNANPHSMLAAIAVLRDVARDEKRRSVAVLGEMKELGAVARSEHAAIGEFLASEGIELVIGTGGLIDHALDAARAGGVQVRDASNVENAIKIALAEIGPKDVVLVKASRSVGVEAVLRALVAARGPT